MGLSRQFTSNKPLPHLLFRSGNGESLETISQFTSRVFRLKSPSEAVLITGGAGFIGTALCSSCRKAGFSVLGLDTKAPVVQSNWSRFAIGRCEDIDLTELCLGRDLSTIF